MRKGKASPGITPQIQFFGAGDGLKSDYHRVPGCTIGVITAAMGTGSVEQSHLITQTQPVIVSMEF